MTSSRRPARAVKRGALAILLVTLVAIAPAVSATTSAAAVGTEYYPVSGAGSTWSANAVQQWVRNVFDNYRWKVNYEDRGSTAGRQLFSQGTVDFAVSEIPYALAGSDSPDPRPERDFSYVPIVAGGTSFMYNLVIGGKRVTNLRLSGETIAKIFTGVITKWNDPAVASDNPLLALPAISIVPVVRSDGSGTTAQLTTWMRSEFPSVWSAYCARAGRSNCGITSNYPVISGSAFVAQQGSNSVAGFVSQDKSVGAITYVEASYALNARFPVAKVLNAAGYYTEPTASNVAVSLLAARINNDPQSVEYLTANLSAVYRNTDPRTYPLSSYSYMIIPTSLESQFTENRGLTLADFVSYFLCEGQQQAEVLGYSPLPVNLAAAGLEQAQKIPGGNPINKNISSCNNPTFSSDGTNKLATTAPQPQACDKRGSTQCLTGTGGASGTSTAASGGTTGGGAVNPSEGTDGGSDGGEAAPDDGAVGALSGDGPTVVAGSPVELPDRGIPPLTIVLMLLSVMLAVTAILVPPMIARRRAFAAANGSPPRVRQASARRGTGPVQRIHLRDVFRKANGRPGKGGDS